MAYRVEIGSRADAQLQELDPIVGATVERKIIWLAENAAIHDPSAARGDAR
jgi:mRNA-degrading endonuclease RelE of RelBE toxin-antitoxin system